MQNKGDYENFNKCSTLVKSFLLETGFIWPDLSESSTLIKKVEKSFLMGSKQAGDEDQHQINQIRGWQKQHILIRVPSGNTFFFFSVPNRRNKFTSKIVTESSHERRRYNSDGITKEILEAYVGNQYSK